MKRIITYDLKQGNTSDYQELCNVFKVLNGTQLTESSYVINTSLSQEKIKKMIKDVIYSDDIVYYISVNQNGELFYSKI